MKDKDKLFQFEFREEELIEELKKIGRRRKDSHLDYVRNSEETKEKQEELDNVRKNIKQLKTKPKALEKK